MVIMFNFKRRRYFGYAGLLVRMTRKQDFLKALSEIRSNTPLSISDYGLKYVGGRAAGRPRFQGPSPFVRRVVTPFFTVLTCIFTVLTCCEPCFHGTIHGA